MSNIINEDKNELRRYLLGQLGEAEEERLELRLLTDAAFIEEFDTVVDEITDQYVGNDLGTEERKRVEQYFLTSSTRQQKVQFADELMQHAAAERGVQRVSVPTPAPGFFERLRAFWAIQPVFFRTATTIATLVIVVGLALLMYPRPGSGTYTAVNLQINAGDRASGAEVKPVRLQPTDAGIRIALALPDQARDATSYRVELLDEQERSRDLTIADRTPQSVIVTIPANEITRGQYIIHLYADGQRVRGSYSFTLL